MKVIIKIVINVYPVPNLTVGLIFHKMYLNTYKRLFKKQNKTVVKTKTPSHIVLLSINWKISS